MAKTKNTEPMAMVKPVSLDIVVSEKRLHAGEAGVKVVTIVRSGTTGKLTSIISYEK